MFRCLPPEKQRTSPSFDPMFPSSHGFLTLIFFSVKILRVAWTECLHVLIFYLLLILSQFCLCPAATILLKLFSPEMTMLILPSNPMATLVCIWLVFSLVFSPFFLEDFLWCQALFIFFFYLPMCPPEKISPQSKYLIDVWTKNLHLLSLYSCFLFFSLCFFILPCCAMDRSASCSLVEDGEEFWAPTLPCMT